MKKITITREIDGWAQEYCKSLKYRNIQEGEISSSCKKLSELKNDIQNGQYKVEGMENEEGGDEFSHGGIHKLIDYIEKIRQDYETLLTVHPKAFNRVIGEFEVIIPKEEVDRIKLKNTAANKIEFFYEIIVRCMRYPHIQSKVFPEYVRRMGIKTCVYCNAQYAITTEGEGMESLYELDHCLPKSKYPYLSANFFNLQPCCGPCNRRKLANDMMHGDYFATIWREEGDEEKDYFFFHLKDESVAKYLTDYRRADIDVELRVMEDAPEDVKSLYQDYCNYFRINGLYGEHKDVAEELMWKKYTYNKALVQSLKDAFGSKANITELDVKRLVMGYYMDENDVYKRPLSKMVQDVARQLHIDI